ncbi:Outer membrane protein (OmpH-like) [Roseivivax sp. THAF40]|uniref:OmpH family outer membrane protein n=1 Tax=unclassified Roseivivax TaxID=2639302 RepID=UPI0012678893|nr:MULTISPECIES: OmpH family outer membrane protein [unclassified Roseivivax]QFS83303.1 Outer membrane protein (OmpH-like) [Roseivivax sp. THAF197b]QFT47047.1 Outer membrane protein (OmpH-like) [Roseivivax sp. THAF40]
MTGSAAIRTSLAAALLALGAWAAFSAPALAQTADQAPVARAEASQQENDTDRQIVRSPILTLESERLFTDSALGQRLIGDVEAAGQALAAENREIEAELSQEERRLTDLRAETDAAQFRALADAFDARVQELRQRQDAKARDLANRGDRVRRVFFNAVQPVLTDILREAGGALIIERANVLLSANAIDITDLAIARVDARIGNGEGISLPDPAAAPENAAPNPSGAQSDRSEGGALFDMGDPDASPAGTE